MRAPWAIVLWVGALSVSAAREPANDVPIRFRTERSGYVSINIYAPDGVLVRPLLSRQWFAAGQHSVPSGGKRGTPPTGDDEKGAAGEYTWRRIFHEGIGLKLRGWACNDGAIPWDTPDGKG